MRVHDQGRSLMLNYLTVLKGQGLSLLLVLTHSICIVSLLLKMIHVVVANRVSLTQNFNIQIFIGHFHFSKRIVKEDQFQILSKVTGES